MLRGVPCVRQEDRGPAPSSSRSAAPLVCGAADDGKRKSSRSTSVPTRLGRDDERALHAKSVVPLDIAEEEIRAGRENGAVRRGLSWIDVGTVRVVQDVEVVLHLAGVDLI